LVNISRFEGALAAAATASVENARWPSALAKLAEAAGAEAALLLPASPTVRPLQSPSGQGLIEEYVREDWGRRNLRIERAMQTPVLRALKRTITAPHLRFSSSFVCEADLFPNNEFVGSVYYEDYMARHNLRWSCGAPLLTVTGDVIFVTFERRPDQSPFQRSELEKLNKLLPELQTAASITSIVANAGARGMLAAFDSIELAAYLLDTAGRIFHLNETGERLARENELLRHGRLVALTRDGQREIDDLIGAAISPSKPGGTCLLPVCRKRPGMAPLIVHAIPVPHMAIEPFSNGRAVVVVVDPEKRHSPEENVLCALYQLTAAEARVACGIAQGMTVESVALKHGVSPLTIRSQLKAVLAKTGAKRQAELVLLLTGVISPRAPP